MAENRRDNTSDRKVLDAEIVDPGFDASPTGQQRDFGPDNPVFISSVGTLRTSGCAPSLITLGIALVCLGQYGFLAALGFYVFYLVGALIGIFILASKILRLRLLTFIPIFLWSWRVCNWLISYLLTAWLAGGFNN